MAIVNELNAEAWSEWLSGRPQIIKEMAEKRPPNLLYKMSSSGHRVTIHSYSEDGTVTVNVTGEFNALTFERKVFGINPDDLVECALPGDDEVLGALLTGQDEIETFIEATRGDINCTN